MHEPGWMLLLHRLPAGRGTERTTLWRKLKKIGALPLEAGGHLLPDRPELRERLGWMAEQVRQAGGEAALVNTDRIEGLPRERLVTLFQQARAEDYAELTGELRALRAKTGSTDGRLDASVERCRARLGEIKAVDYFPSPAAAVARTLLEEVQARLRGVADPMAAPVRLDAADYRGRTWLTRPRPEIDRVGSAWLIRRCVDAQARFVFSPDPASHPEAIPFDLAGVEFSHHGDDCSFETLVRRFGMADPALHRLAEMVHDADLEDNKFARPEALGLDRALKGWALLGAPDEELLRRGTEAFDALHAWLETTELPPSP